MKTQVCSPAPRIAASQERLEAKLDVCRQKIDAWLENVKDSRKETAACQEAA
jgi:hypothetical protein